MEGQGTFTWADGGVYEGQWKKDISEGGYNTYFVQYFSRKHLYLNAFYICIMSKYNISYHCLYVVI